MKAFPVIPTGTVAKTKFANAKPIDIPHDFLRDMKNAFHEKPLPEIEFLMDLSIWIQPVLKRSMEN